MRHAIANAAVGDDVYGDDPTVIALEAQLAERVGKVAAVFVPSGTQSNLAALLAHCARGDEYLVGFSYHCYRYEAGGAAVLGSIQPQPLPVNADGSLDLAAAEAAIKPDDPHFPRSRVICLENTADGRPVGLANAAEARAVADRHGLAVHLDGARLFNAALALGVDVAAVAKDADTVSVCLSKGLGAPLGSVLCGSAELIARARRWRKMLGGGMRQAGLLAAAGLYALEHHVERLADDHANAKRLAQGLADSGRFELEHEPGARTNMVFGRLCEPSHSQALVDHFDQHDIIVRGGPSFRFVTHLDVSAADIDKIIDALDDFTPPATAPR